MYSLSIFYLSSHFFNILDRKQKVLKIFTFVYIELKIEIEIFEIFFFSKKQRKKFSFNQTLDFRNICFRGVTSSFPIFFFRNTLWLPYFFIFFYHSPLSPGQFERGRARPSKSRLTLNDFVPPAPSRHQDEKCHPRRPCRSHRRPYRRRRLLLATAQFAKSRCSPIKVTSFSEILNPDLSFTLALPRALRDV